MSMFSENFKIVNGLPPAADSFATGSGVANLTDVVSLKLYRYATFIIITGASAANNSAFSVVAGTAVGGTVTTTVPFKYRKCISGDTWGALTDVAAGSTIKLTVSTANQMLVIEVDAQAVETAHPGYDCVGLKVEDGGTDAAQLGAGVIIMSGPRYADALQPSAIVD